MTPKELHDELVRNNIGSIKDLGLSRPQITLLSNNKETILRALSALSGLEGVKGALEFYAQEGNWHPQMVMRIDARGREVEDQDYPEVDNDRGDRARSALSQLEQEKT